MIKTFDITGQPTSAVVHYNVTAKPAGYETFGEVIEVANEPNNSPSIGGSSSGSSGGDDGSVAGDTAPPEEIAPQETSPENPPVTETGGEETPPVSSAPDPEQPESPSI